MLRDLVSNKKGGKKKKRKIPKTRCAITEQLPPTYKQKQQPSVTNTVPVNEDGVVPGHENHMVNHVQQRGRYQGC